MSACIIAAQLVMMPVAKFTGDRADAWGRRPIFLIAFAALILRGLLYTVSPDPYWIVGVQLLDGIGAGIFGVLWVIVAADLTRGTGRYNLVLGAIATAASLGAALSNFTAGYVVDWTSYPGGFLFLSGWAVVAFLVFYFGVPETRPAVEVLSLKCLRNWWSQAGCQAGSNRRPRECHSRALPTELWPRDTSVS